MGDNDHVQTAIPTGDSGIRLAIIGLGVMGNEMLDAAAGHPDFVVAGAADLSPAAVEAARSRHPQVSFGTDPHRTATSTDIDAVYIATPPNTHAQLAIEALRTGKAVFCEKPLAVELTDGRQMLAAAEQSGAVTAVNFSLADRNAVLYLEDAVRSGELGTVAGVDIRFAFSRWPRDFQVGATWVAGRRQGGLVREVFSHFAFLTDRLLGPLRVIDANVDYPPGDPEGAERAAHALLRAGEIPVRVSAIAGVAAPELYEWIIWGTQRSYLFRDWDELLVTDGHSWTPVELGGERGSEATRLSRFATAVRGEPAPHLADFAAAFLVQQVVEAFHRR